MDKTKKKKAGKKMESTSWLEEEPSSSIDQLYAQVDNTNKKKANKKLHGVYSTARCVLFLHNECVNV